MSKPAMHRLLLGLFLAQFALIGVGLWLPWPQLAEARWPDAILLLLATATTLAWLSRQLPLQNVAQAAIVVALVGGTMQSIGTLTAFPFGAHVYGARLGPKLFGVVPWAIPSLWIVAVLNSRGTAGLVLRHWRSAPGYGYWLLGLTILLVVVFDAGLELFAGHIKGYWSWPAKADTLNWNGLPWTYFLGLAATTLLILALATPALINKSPLRPDPAYQPLLIWLVLNSLFTMSAARHLLWTAAATLGAITLFVLVPALRPAKPSTARTAGPEHPAAELDSLAGEN